MPQERAGDSGATARRLLGELGPYSGKLVLVLGLVVLGAAAQAGGPWLIGRAIDRYILRGDTAGLSRIMLVLLGVYVVGAIASRGQVYQVGYIGRTNRPPCGPGSSTGSSTCHWGTSTGGPSET